MLSDVGEYGMASSALFWLSKGPSGLSPMIGEQRFHSTLYTFRTVLKAIMPLMDERLRDANPFF